MQHANTLFHAKDYSHKKTGRTRIKNPSFSTSAFENSLSKFSTDLDFVAIKNTIGRLGDMLEGLAAVREMPDPTKPREAVALDYLSKYEKTRKVAEQQLLSAASRLQSAQNNAKAAMLNKTKLHAPSGRAAEIRATFRQLPENERLAFLEKSVKSGNSEILAAVLDAPVELSMLPQDKVNAAQSVFIATYAPEYEEISAALDTAQLRLELAYDAFLKESDDLRDKGIETQAEQGQKAAQEASKALDYLLG